MRRAGRTLLLLGALLLGFLRGAGRRVRRERIVPEGETESRAELVVIGLLLAATVCAVMFLVVYALNPAHLTQYLGLCLGIALALLAAALIIAGEKLVVTEQLEEDYPPLGDPEEEAKVEQIVTESGSRLTRKRLLGGAAGLAGGTLGAALIAPAASLGPVLDTESFYYSPWKRGRRLVDDAGKPLSAEEIEEETFYTAYPENAEREELAAPLVLVRLDPAALELPAERKDWAPGESSLTRRSALTPPARSLCIARHASKRRSPSRRWSVPATTRPSIPPTGARSNSARPAATCRSCR